MAEPDRAVQALRALVKVLDGNIERARYVQRRAEHIETLRDQGYTWEQVLSTEDRPLIVDVLNQSMALLTELGGRLRREEARCLVDEGLKEQQIADLLDVSLDHVQAMLSGT
ncbi:MAG: hypothetical protein JO086_10190 [Acidimicrobiia bacterium]|nr:hypothetical protein [Acidimicrobiia bacterium]